MNTAAFPALLERYARVRIIIGVGDLIELPIQLVPYRIRYW